MPLLNGLDPLLLDQGRRIVAQRFRYIQVAVLYDQAADVTETDKLPDNQFGTWMANKLPKLSTNNAAADQLAVLAAALP